MAYHINPTTALANSWYMPFTEYVLISKSCSLEELRKFATDRKIPCKYTYPQSHRKKSQRKQQDGERRKLLAAPRRDDATKTFCLLDLPRELRDEVYHFFIGHKPLMAVKHRQRLQCMPEQIRDEMSAAFDKVWQKRTAWEKRFEELVESLHGI
jgi:hypothetical protein